ncbi:MAG: choice-of-anchor D domain-containing protein [Bacteroidales bacterium]|jgi:outer membrane protein assembly factor BamB|nr:choice-of-anchor D domain-containing protein [Bacteroidales bacterium]NLM92663.1 choice-of-anchor D domain-containing protein [Bacteroidales bacterium]
MKKSVLFSVLLSLLCLIFLPGQEAWAQDEGWTVVNQWTVNNNASGLAYDGTYFYIGTYGSNGGDVYRFDPAAGTNNLLFTGPQEDAFGLTYDGDYLWTINQVSPSSAPAIALQLDMEGNVVSQFNLPTHYMSGIACDSDYFWVAAYYPDPGTIYQVDAQGTQLSSFAPPADQPWDLAVQGDSLWIIDYWNGTIDLVSKDGTMVESFPYPDYRASGIWHDGTYLWYVGRSSSGASTLYQVNPWGGGTPVISVPQTYHFGNVTLGETASWELQFSNTGTGELVIEGISFLEGNTVFSLENAEFPITVEAAGSASVTVVFTPDAIEEFFGTMSIHSNDPAQPVVNVDLHGFGLFDGAYLSGVQEMIDFGAVRINSTNRLYLFIKNMGSSPLVFDDMAFSSDYFYWDESICFPLMVNPVEEMELSLWFRPLTEGVVNEMLTMTFNNEEQSPLSVMVKGFSDDTPLLLGEVLWEHQFTGSYDFHARAIMPVADMTGDGMEDVVVGTRDNKIRLFNGNASGNTDLIWERLLGTVEYPKGLDRLDDINDDGFPDVVAGTAWGDCAVTALCGKTGEILWRFLTNVYGAGGWVYMVDVKYDYNGDGYKDVLAASGDDGDGTGPKRVFLLDALSGQVIWDSPLNGAVYSVLAIEDVNGDGIPDVLAGATSPGEKGMVFCLDGADGGMIWDLSTPGTAVWALEQIDDITEDEISDVIIGTFNGVYYLLDATDGNIEAQGSLGNSIILDFWVAGDLNGDGYDDIFPAYSTQPNAVAISGLDGQVLWSTMVSDQPWSVIPVGDVSGDGITDVAVGTLYQNNKLYVMNGTNGTILFEQTMPAPVDAIGNLGDVTGDHSLEFIAGTRNGWLAAFAGGLDAAEPQWEVTFHVKDAAEPANNLQDVTIVISETGNTLQTDEEGIAALMLANGTYNYTASKEGFFDSEGGFEMDGEEMLVEIILQVDDTDVPALSDPRLVKAFSYPNPLRDHTQIAFTLTRGEVVSLRIYDLNGGVVKTFDKQAFPAGENTIRWDGRDQQGNVLPDGMYLFELITPTQSFKNRMLILRN